MVQCGLTALVCVSSVADCPDLYGMDSQTMRCLIAAYRCGSYNGETPGDIYTAWEDGQEPPEKTPCVVCQEAHWCAFIP